MKETSRAEMLQLQEIGSVLGEQTSRFLLLRNISVTDLRFRQSFDALADAAFTVHCAYVAACTIHTVGASITTNIGVPCS